MIYFDNAATTGHKPESVKKAVLDALRIYSVNPGRGGYKESIKCSEMIYGCRKKVAELFGASGPERVVFVPNCTAALNFVIKGVLKKGDHCVASVLEHNAVSRPLYKLSKAGVSVDFADAVFDDDEKTVEAFRRLIRPNTKLVVCTHASNVNGQVLPIEKIGALCKERNILFAVDAAQTAGILSIDMKKQNIDYLCVAAHKGLYSPMGLGVLIAEKNLENTLIEGGTGNSSLQFEQPKELPERFESGTVNVPAIAGLSASIDFVKSRGIEHIYSYEMSLARDFYKGLKEISEITILSPPPKNEKTVPTIAFNMKNKKSEEIAELLAAENIAVRAGFHCAALAHKKLGTEEMGAVRVCFSIFNSEAEIKRVLSVLKKVIKN